MSNGIQRPMTYDELLAALTTALAREARMRGELRRVEWIEPSRGNARCPRCFGTMATGHDAECSLAAALA